MDHTATTLTTTPQTPAQAEQDRTWSLALRIIDLARGLIVSDNPYLSSSIGLLKTAQASLPDTFACDGQTLYVDAARLLKQFSQERVAPSHDMAHILLHCLLLHPFVDASVDGPAWDLAADLVAEGLVREILGQRPGERGRSIEAILKQLASDLGNSLTTERLYRALRDGAYKDVREQWKTLVHVDGHHLWPPAQAPADQSSQGADQSADSDDSTSDALSQATDVSSANQSASDGMAAQRRLEQQSADAAQETAPQNEGAEGKTEASSAAGDESGTPTLGSKQKPLSDSQRAQAEQAWSRAAKSMRVDLQTLSRSIGSGLGGLVRELEVGTHERIDYREFLRQFAVEHEDMRLSEDEFDYVFYTYGLELYGNVPLVEPLEYRSEKRIRDFVIVLDTSSSVQAPVVQEFVNTTFDVLSSEGGFFSQTNIHIIQADARVQSDAKITSLADLDRWRRTIKLHGFGGTDFRPAFAYVQQLRNLGEFDDLQGLIYFTDGWGIYPERMPPYKCAFVFYDEDHRPDLVPPWAIQLVLHPGEYESLSVY